MAKTVGELIEKLKQFDPEALIIHSDTWCPYMGCDPSYYEPSEYEKEEYGIVAGVLI